MFSPLFRSTTPTDGPARGATQGQRHAPDSMRSDDEAARALGSPPSTNQGAHNDQSTVQQNRSLRAELSASSPLRLPEGSLQKAAQAAAAALRRTDLQERASSTVMLAKHRRACSTASAPHVTALWLLPVSSRSTAGAATHGARPQACPASGAVLGFILAADRA
mgnify:CR=1 FL=1